MKHQNETYMIRIAKQKIVDSGLIPGIGKEGKGGRNKKEKTKTGGGWV